MLHGLIMDFQFSWVCSAPRIHQFVTQSSFWWCIHTKVFYIDLSFSMVQGLPNNIWHFTNVTIVQLYFLTTTICNSTTSGIFNYERHGVIEMSTFFRIWDNVVFYSTNNQQLVKLTLYLLPIEQKKSKGCHCWFSKRLPQSESQSWGETFFSRGEPLLTFFCLAFISPTFV